MMDFVAWVLEKAMVPVFVMHAKMLVSAFVVLAAALAVILSLERILARPIPNLSDSRPVQRNRAYAAVLVCMAASFFLVLPILLRLSICSDCELTYAWQDPEAIATFSIIALAISSTIGWIVFATVSIASAIHFIFRSVSN